MAAAATDLIIAPGNPGTATSLAAPGYTIGGTSVTVGSTANWGTATGQIFAMDEVETVNGVQVRVDGTYNEYVGTVASGTSITNVSHITGSGTDRNYSAGATTRVYVPVSSNHLNKLHEALTEEHNQDGTHSDVTADSITVTGTVTAANFAQSGGADSAGWTVGLPAVSSVTANGNRSYTVEMASDVSDTLSEGMRLRTTRTVAAPNTSFSLDGSNDYYSKTSPTGLSFTTKFTCSAWVYLTSYQAGYIIDRMNALVEGWGLLVGSAGQVSLTARRIASNNKDLTTYQSLPLNKWVHVAATMDAAAGDTSAQKIWIDGVEVPRVYTLTGTMTALVQGTTALAVGARSDGTVPFPGYIDQAAVFSDQLSDATIKAMQHQALTGSETSLVSAYSNGSTTDLNTTNANNLTAQSGATTVANSPFGNRGVSTTLDYGLVMNVATTTVTVQVPEGCTIPTSGGVSAVAYSTQANPYGFVSDKGRWYLNSILKTNTAVTSNATYGSFISGGWKLSVPAGAFNVGWRCGLAYSDSTTGVRFNVSDVVITGLAANAVDGDLVQTIRASSAVQMVTAFYVESPRKLTTATDFIMYTLGATATPGLAGSETRTEIFATPLGL